MKKCVARVRAGWQLPGDVCSASAAGVLIARSVRVEPIFLLVKKVCEGKP